MKDMNVLGAVSIAAIICVGVMFFESEDTKRIKFKSDFAAECNKEGGIARQIDGTLNCVKEPA